MSGNVHFMHCTARDIPQHLDSQVDLILFHTMLEWVAGPQAVLKTLWLMLRPDNALSLMFYSASGLLMCDMLVSNSSYIQQGVYKKKRHTLSLGLLRDPQQIYGWLEKIG